MAGRIVRLTVENVKRIEAVDYQPKGNVVLVSGKNKSGKTSVLDSILYALGGEKAVCEQPIRNGAERGRVRLDLGDLVVEKVFSADGGKSGSRLVVRDADGKQLKSPQSVLDRLAGRYTIDPWEFLNLPPAKQRERLMEILGLDFADLEIAREVAYNDRTEVNRSIKRIEGELAGTPLTDGVPEEERSIAELAAEWERRKQHNEGIAELQRKLVDANCGISETAQRVAELKAEIARLQAQVSDKELRLVELEDQRDDLQRAIASAKPADENSVREEMQTVERTNALVRRNRHHRQLQEQLATLMLEAEGRTDVLADLDRQRDERIRSANFPVPGLGFRDAGVTFDGVPLEQANTESQIRVTVMLGIAAHPDLRVMLVRRGNDLDCEHLELMHRIAEEYDLQIWVERIDGDGVECLHIEEGRVAAQPAAVQKNQTDNEGNNV